MFHFYTIFRNFEATMCNFYILHSAFLIFVTFLLKPPCHVMNCVFPSLISAYIFAKLQLQFLIFVLILSSFSAFYRHSMRFYLSYHFLITYLFSIAYHLSNIFCYAFYKTGQSVCIIPKKNSCIFLLSHYIPPVRRS